MRSGTLILFAILVAYTQCGYSQSPPWESPLKISRSADGTVFDEPAIFQDSSGVPSVIRWHGDTLICAFQWFRLPVNTPTWDRVAVKFSYDLGLNWTQPVPIIVDGLPANYQRPFDPTLAVFGGDSIRIYFSSSDGFPMGGLSAIVNTYSAKSADGIHFTFEPDPRVDEPSNRVIDPAVIRFNQLWHYAAPVGSPQAGAYHYISNDGVHFTAVPPIDSDPQHNWTGNYMVDSPQELRFYGNGPDGIWYNTSPNGGMWNGYVTTNIRGGDPSAIRISQDQYLMIYVGEPYTVATREAAEDPDRISIFPNPASNMAQISYLVEHPGDISVTAFDASGKLIRRLHSGFQPAGQHSITWDKFTGGFSIPPGLYFIRFQTAGGSVVCRMTWQ